MQASSIRPVTLLLVAACAPFIYCNGKSRIVSFSAVVLQPKDKFILPGNDVMLKCETEGRSSSIQIKRRDDERPLSTSDGTGLSLTYLFQPVSCDDMGTYECILDLDPTNREQTVVHVSNCPPRSCHGDDVNRTIHVDVNQTVQISLCVLVYPNLLEYLKFNNSIVRMKNLINWTWDFSDTSSSRSSIKRFNISVTREQMVKEEYGILNIRVYSSFGELFSLVYHITLRPPGAPECPTDVRVAVQSTGFIFLSWRPGLDGGSTQFFRVYFSKDNVTWLQFPVIANETSLNTNTLEEHINYSFKVVSFNMYGDLRTEADCDNLASTLNSERVINSFSQTTDILNREMTNKHPGTENTDNHLFYIILPIGCSFFLLLIALVIFLTMMIQKAKRHNIGRQGHAGNTRNGDTSLTTLFRGPNPNPGDYVSEEGLHYVTVEHAQDKPSKNKRQKKKRIKRETVQYAVVDFAKTAQMKISQEGRSVLPQGRSIRT